jgi:hypothetical protein
MHSDTLTATDEYSAKKATHPRVSLSDMQSKIATEAYFTAGAAGDALGIPMHDSAKLLTICIITMKNGFTLVGKSAPASPENFDQEKGNRFAYEDAIKQLWPLEGYALREKLAA